MANGIAANMSGKAGSDEIGPDQTTFETDIPARLDRLEWGRFHTLVIVALGVTWVLDGLEVTLAGTVSGALKASPTLHLSDAQVGFAASAYLAGAVVGAFVFGWLTDRLGRKRLFNVTLGVYLVATALSAFSQDFWTFALFRCLTGAGIGGEYTAINSAIQELIPARYRGRTDLIVNGSFWIGAALAALGATVLLDPHRLPADLGWRIAFGIGALLGLIIVYLRRFIPESPRWLMLHGRLDEAQRILAGIELQAVMRSDESLRTIRLRARRGGVNLFDVARTLFGLYPRRALLGVALMAAQAFFYNAIFFSYALVLDRYFEIAPERVGVFVLPFALGNFLGPLLLGRLFDTIGRRVMITLTYAITGVLAFGAALLFFNGVLDAHAQTLAWSVVFFFASAAASSAYLTISESFPLEVRALAIAVFYAFGTALGGVAAPWLFGTLVGTGARGPITLGYVFGAALMVIAACIEWRIGVAAERRALEDVAAPLSQASDDGEVQ
jgi:MFS family permease